jgi:hypothetical protein
MARRKKPVTSLSEQLRERIAAAELSVYELARDAGVGVLKLRLADRP